MFSCMRCACFMILPNPPIMTSSSSIRSWFSIHRLHRFRHHPRLEQFLQGLHVAVLCDGVLRRVLLVLVLALLDERRRLPLGRGDGEHQFHRLAQMHRERLLLTLLEPRVAQRGVRGRDHEMEHFAASSRAMPCNDKSSIMRLHSSASAPGAADATGTASSAGLTTTTLAFRVGAGVFAIDVWRAGAASRGAGAGAPRTPFASALPRGAAAGPGVRAAGS